MLDSLDIYMVETMDEVLKIALTEPVRPITAISTTGETGVQPTITDDTATH